MFHRCYDRELGNAFSPVFEDKWPLEMPGGKETPDVRPERQVGSAR